MFRLPTRAPCATLGSVFRDAGRQRLVRAMSEAEAAKAAASAANSDGPTIFDKIIDKSIPADVIHEDDVCMAFRDISPCAPVHFLVIPKVKGGLSRLSKATEADKSTLGHMMLVAQQVAKQEGLTSGDQNEDGFRVVINDGPKGCQSVYHLHLHVIGGRQGIWPPF